MIDPEECVHASVATMGGGRYVVCLQRADRKLVPAILCGSREGAAALVREMNPWNAQQLIADLDLEAAATALVEGLADAIESQLTTNR